MKIKILIVLMLLSLNVFAQNNQDNQTRWNNMSEEEKQVLRERFNRWDSMPKEEKVKLTEKWEKFKSLPLEKREQIRKAFKQWQALPSEKRTMIKERFEKIKNMDPKIRAEKIKMIRQRSQERHQRLQRVNRR